MADIETPVFDAVIAAVDGTNEEWQRERARFLGDPSATRCREGVSETRFRYYGTILPQVLLIRKCMPFVRRVFVVLSGPSQERIIEDLKGADADIVYHRDFIPEEYLPTFNSHAIELFLWKIPGLSDFFLYFNDDQFVLGPVKRSMFVKDSGVARVATDHDWPTGNFRYLPPDPSGYKSCNLKSSRLAWQLVSRRDDAPNVVAHCSHCLPYNLHRPTCSRAFSLLDRTAPGTIARTATRFRDYSTNIAPTSCTYPMYYGFLHQGRNNSLYSDKDLVSGGVVKHCGLSRLVPRHTKDGTLPFLYMSRGLKFVCLHDDLAGDWATDSDFQAGAGIVRDMLYYRMEHLEKGTDRDE